MKSIALFALLAATPALADCPIGADLAGGIRVVESDGTMSIFTSNGNGVVQQDVTYSDGFQTRNLFGQGVHLLQIADVENGALAPDSMQNMSYDMPPSDLPVPTASSKWSVSTVVNAFGEIYGETQSQSWGTPFTLTIGACSYTALVGKIAYRSDGYSIDEVVHYIPDLRLSLLYSFDDSESSLETFIPVQIEAVR